MEEYSVSGCSFGLLSPCLGDRWYLCSQLCQVRAANTVAP